jgi:hypothetical protein
VQCLRATSPLPTSPLRGEESTQAYRHNASNTPPAKAAA